MMKPYAALTPEEKKRICNGCGAKGGRFPVPQFIFEADCDRHDYGYSAGVTEADRKRCDRGFYRAMQRDARRYSFPRRWHYLLWAWVYYRFVRKCGCEHFNYHE